jgi:hypothetical protein
LSISFGACVDGLVSDGDHAPQRRAGLLADDALLREQGQGAGVWSMETPMPGGDGADVLQRLGRGP